MLPLSCGLMVDRFVPVAVVLLSKFLVQLSSKVIRTRFIYYYSLFSSTQLSSLVLVATKVSVVALSSYSRGFHFTINC